MSEYRPKTESDAVLASVRRLVAAEPMPALESERSPAEKLLLTPAFRIEEEPVRDTSAGSGISQEGAAAAASLEQRIAELEAAVGGQSGDWEPDGSEEFDEETPHHFVFQHTPRHVEPGDADVLEEPDTAKANQQTAPPAEPDGPTQEDDAKTVEIGEDLFVDEEMLRDIVAEIVRSELQGELGERITRNVRKLVRREIHRAIMTRDFG